MNVETNDLYLLWWHAVVQYVYVIARICQQFLVKANDATGLNGNDEMML